MPRPPIQRRGARSWPATRHLMFLSAIVAVPLLALLGVLLERWATQERQRLERTIVHEGERIAAAIDRDIERRVTLLQALSTSLPLALGDWAAFYAQAKASVPNHYIILRDADGRVLVNTYVPFGAEPQRTIDMATIDTMRRTLGPVVSGIFVSQVVKEPVYNVSIPILREGRLTYVLSLGLLPTEVLRLLEDQKLEPSWMATVWDQNGTIVARSHARADAAGATVPQDWRSQPRRQVVETEDLDGRKVLAIVDRTGLAGWSVRVTLPAEIVDRRIYRSLTVWAASAASVVILTALAALMFGHRFARPLAATARAAAGLGRGEPVELSDTPVLEVNEVNRALREAAGELERRAAALRQSEEVLGTAAEAAQFGAHRYDVANDRVVRSPQIRRILGADPSQDRDFESALDFVHPDDRDDVRRRKRHILQAESRYQLTYRIRRPDGEVRWVMDRGQVERDPSGQAVRVIGVLVDVSELKEAELRQRLLFDELNHRVKNTLAIVQALAQQTLASKPEPKAFAAAFGDRIAALARAHDLLTEGAWLGASLDGILTAVLKPFADRAGRIEAIGPSVDIPSNATIALALTFHELATNAAKHGALSTAAGTLRIDWTVDRLDKTSAVDLTWQERGGPAIAPPAGRGFGTRLLTATARQIDGTIDLDFARDGLRCRLQFRVSSMPAAT